MDITVLHVAPHYGGGVGKVVRSLIDDQQVSNFVHRLLALESINEVMLQWAGQRQIACLSNALLDTTALNQWLGGADIIHLHWWNHPLLMYWMVYVPMPPIRCILWSHVNGLYAPQVFFKGLFTYPDCFVFSTAYSFQSPCVAEYEADIKLVQSRSKVKLIGARVKKNDACFGIGYIGTVDYIKMHPEFINLCLNARIDDAKFIVCGGPQQDLLRHQVVQVGVESRFDIRGVITDVNQVLFELDVFGYPLNPEHYGTGEQVLLEAMGAGVVPVVLDTGCEKYIIDHGKNGIIATSLEEYSAALNYLRQNIDVLRSMSRHGVEKTRDLMALQGKDAWTEHYLSLLQRDKSQHNITVAQELLSFSKGSRLLLQSYGSTEWALRLLRDLLDKSKKLSAASFPSGLFSATRGSPYHYLKYFPSDPVLQIFCERLDHCKTMESTL